MDNDEVMCVYCGKLLKGDDIVYYLESESNIPYCCEEHVKKNLDISDMYARCWNNKGE